MINKTRKKIAVVAASIIIAAATGGYIYASDHTDSPTVTGKSTDITDLYAFQSPTNTNNLVLVGNTQGLLTPSATGAASFDANTLIQFSIDNTGDNIEDLVIQAKADGNGNMVFYGPIKPTTTGTQSQLEGSVIATVPITKYGASSPSVVTTANGITCFAGPRDDPFFFDLDQFKKVVAGTAIAFNKPGVDHFAGTNVLSVVVELPKTLLDPAAKGNINVWLTTRTKK